MSASHNAVLAQLEESRAETRRLQKEAKEEAVAAAERYSELQHETDTLRHRVTDLESDATALRKKVQHEAANVVKYKKMVGEIGRLIDWAQAASPAGSVGRVSLGGAAATGATAGTPGSASQLIPAFREGARLSLGGGGAGGAPRGVGVGGALTPLDENVGRGVVWSPVNNNNGDEAAAKGKKVASPTRRRRGLRNL